MSEALTLARQNQAQQRRIETAQRASRVLVWPLSYKGFPWHLFRFGWQRKSGSATQITLKAGSVTRGTLTAISTVDTDVTIGASKTYVGIQVKWALSDLTVISSTSVPGHDDTYFKRWFFAFELVGGLATLVEANGLPGNIDITTTYGA